MIVKTRTSVKYQGVWYKAHEVLDINEKDFVEKAFEKVQTTPEPLKPVNQGVAKKAEEPKKEENIKDKIENMKRQELLSALKERNLQFAVTEPNEDLKKRLLNNW
jgi:pyruvate/2-oxoacid:ferredoxin oxidoreductase beta subunit